MNVRLHAAIEANDPHLVSECLAAGADPNEKGLAEEPLDELDRILCFDEPLRPLNRARSAKVADLLIDAGADCSLVASSWGMPAFSELTRRTWVEHLLFANAELRKRLNLNPVVEAPLRGAAEL